MFSTVEKIIREPDFVRSAGSDVAYFYVLFYAFFEFVVLAVYVAALETSTRLKSRDSRTCKQALEEDSGFTAAGEPLQVYPRETDGQSFRHGLVHGFA